MFELTSKKTSPSVRHFTLGPLLMVSEDLQWSDPTSLELMDLVIDRVASLPALLIVTFRPEFAPRWVGRR